MRDVIGLEPLVEGERRADFERYVSLVAASASEAMSMFWAVGDNEDIAYGLLRKLARLSDATIPVDFGYEQAGGADKTANTASILARLADEHG
jgi:hypothetical protein